MKHPNAIRAGSSTDHLSVIHGTSSHQSGELLDLQNVVIQTDLSFNITGWNYAAEILHTTPWVIGKNLFELTDIRFPHDDIENFKRNLADKGNWCGEMIFSGYDGQLISLFTTVTSIINEKDKTVAILFISQDIDFIRNKEKQLIAAEKKYETLMNTLPDGVVMINADGKIAACNEKAAAILGLTEEELLGRLSDSPSWKAIRPDGSVFPLTEFPAVVSLQTGFPQRNVKMGVEQPNGMLVWISINSQALIRPGEFDPYAVVVSYSDITDSMNTEKELKRSNERFYYVSKVTSDAIWDIDLETRQIYRNEAFFRLSGYSPDEVDANMDWWFSKVHPDDRERVRNKVNEYMQKGSEQWDDEYWFECADGSYKYLLDSGIILYRNKKPLRILGAIRDLTEKKKLEKQLLDERDQKHMAIAQASIAAQEEEKSKISKELHDNVNQILMSVKLFMDTAKRTPERADELLSKAMEYQALALEEIRKLSKSLSSIHVTTIGLRESVTDIVQNMKQLQHLDVEFLFNDSVEEKLSNDQKLMLFRIIQEQTNNIIKYAGAKKVQIEINEENGQVILLINDDGRGFDQDANSTKGIGFINITSRANAYNGKVNIVSSPGNGCRLELKFPFQ